MGKIGLFLEHGRQDPGYRSVTERINDFRTVEMTFTEESAHVQMGRCLECGTPFCHGYGCPLANVIPELNDLAWQKRWEEALAILLAHNPFPEFTGRLCPALCEAACVLAINDDAVAIRQIELAIIEKGFAKGYLQPSPPAKRFEERVAVIGSGPAGLAVADTLNKSGYPVVVYERAAKIGGILRYGIPDFKLEKWVLDRRIQLMEKEGIRFETGVTVGTDIAYKYLTSRFKAICLCGGAGQPRDLKVPGRDLEGIHFAMDYLVAQNKKNGGEYLDAAMDIDARGKKVVIIGGGDTGADCLGTAIRQGAKSVFQLEILPEPPRARPATTPWPMWPSIRRDASSHQEGGRRRWGVSATSFKGNSGHVSRVQCVEVDHVHHPEGQGKFIPRQGTEFELEADLVLMALGYIAPDRTRLAEDIHHACGRQQQFGASEASRSKPRNFPAINGKYQMAGDMRLFVAGDMRSGPSLVAKSIADGISSAREIVRWLKGTA